LKIRLTKPNRFAARAAKAPLVVMLDSDVSKVFRTPDSVNAALRALIMAMSSATKPGQVQAGSKRGGKTLRTEAPAERA